MTRFDFGLTARKALDMADKFSGSEKGPCGPIHFDLGNELEYLRVLADEVNIVAEAARKQLLTLEQELRGVAPGVQECVELPLVDAMGRNFKLGYGKPKGKWVLYIESSRRLSESPTNFPRKLLPAAVAAIPELVRKLTKSLESQKTELAP